MYQTVQSGMASSQARERLLSAAVEQAVRGGIIGQSLREIAAAIGTSHRMLLYHFKSREGLLIAICNTLNEAVAGALDQWDDPRQLWEHFADPQAWPFERFFFELYAHALFGGPGAEDFVEASVHRWIDGLAANWSRRELTSPPPGSRRACTSPWPAGCCSTCSPPATATASTRPMSTIWSSPATPPSSGRRPSELADLVQQPLRPTPATDP